MAGFVAADGGHVESLRFLLEEVCVADRGGRLRAELRRLEREPVRTEQAEDARVCNCRTSICPHMFA